MATSDMAKHAQRLADAAEELREQVCWLENTARAVAEGRSVRNLDEALLFVDRVERLSAEPDEAAIGRATEAAWDALEAELDKRSAPPSVHRWSDVEAAVRAALAALRGETR